MSGIQLLLLTFGVLAVILVPIYAPTLALLFRRVVVAAEKKLRHGK